MNVRFVAEVSSNHHRDLDRCYAFIDKAAEIGCHAVKFQLFRIKELFAPEVLRRSEAHRRREAWELPVAFLPFLKSRCDRNGIQFSCTPFYLDAVDELMPHVDFYKIASYELLWDALLQKCAKTGKPVVLSTGMATLDEVKTAVAQMHEAGCMDLTLLHCVSGYPTPVTECNLAAIETIRSTFDRPSFPGRCRFGWSDHSVAPAVIYRAIYRWGASLIEFHLDLDGAGDEYRAGHCWLPEQIQAVISIVKRGLEADGDGVKQPAACELPDREWRADPTDGLRPLLQKRQEWRDLED